MLFDEFIKEFNIYNERILGNLKIVYYNDNYVYVNTYEQFCFSLTIVYKNMNNLINLNDINLLDLSSKVVSYYEDDKFISYICSLREIERSIRDNLIFVKYLGYSHKKY